jgi:hypothetical protein
MRRYLFLLLPLLLSLTACVPSREEADGKLAIACQASVKATFSDPKENITVQKASYAFQQSYDGAKLRVVTLNAQYIYGDAAPDDKVYTCSYTEAWSLFAYLPEFYNLQKDTDKFGNFNGSVVGDTTILMKITEANDKVLQ